MNKFAQMLHQKFVAGQINGAVFAYLQKIGSNVDDAALFDKHINNLSQWQANTMEDCQAYFDIYGSGYKYVEKLIHAHLEKKDVEKLNKYAFLNRDNYDFANRFNFCRLALDYIKESGLLKSSHPNNFGIEGSPHVKAPYDLDKWIETMRYIYQTANTNNLPLDKVAEQATSKWDKQERIDFDWWMRYYQEGTYGKYNVKTAQWFMGNRAETKMPDMKQVQDLVEGTGQPKSDPAADKQKRLDDARKKLRSRLKSIEELLEIYRDVLPRDATTIMRKDVFDLKEKILGLELKASFVDSLIRASNQFIKRGFVEGANELKKIAQEVAEDKLPEVKEDVKVDATEEAPVEVKTEEPSEKYVKIPEVDVDQGIDIPDFPSATYRDALEQLEDVNAVLSERNVIRGLAAVDIILGQIGIASHFPKLAEAQSKLMEAYQYAQIRVAEVVGLMRANVEKEQKPVEQPAEKPMPTPPKPAQEDVIEMSEEMDKPVGQIVSGPPPAAQPKSPLEGEEFKIPSKHSIVPG